MSLKALRTSGFVLEVQLDAAHVGLVGDRLRVELQDDREADLLRQLGGGGFGLGDLGDDRRDAVAAQQVLGFRLGQDGAARLS